MNSIFCLAAPFAGLKPFFRAICDNVAVEPSAETDFAVCFTAYSDES
jgi:hypothetical protein